MSNSPTCYQLFFKLPFGLQSLLSRVLSSDLVRDLKFYLEFRVSIRSSLQCLFFQGKKLDGVNPLLVYNIGKDVTTYMVLRLLGGNGGKTSSPWNFSYKGVIHVRTLHKED